MDIDTEAWIIATSHQFAWWLVQEEEEMRRDSDFWDIGSFGAPMTDEEMESAQAPLVVLMQDEPVHTDDKPFCSDMTCGCHRDRALIREHLMEPERAGLLTWFEARALWRGVTL